jgi:ATP-dependent helicase/nuclease subunit A
MITVYSASAGSGKTYTLTREYLRLALGNDYRFAWRHILAVTFTNKATAEMKQRILKELRIISADIQQEHSMSKELTALLQIPGDTLRSRASAVLSQILHDYSGFSISTIDAFFQKIVRNFTREAGLQAGFRLELDLNGVLEAVVQQVLGHLGTPGYEMLDEWVIDMAEEKVENGEKWDFRTEMLNLGKQLFRETLMRKEDELNSLNAGDQSFISHRNQLFRNIEQKEQYLSGIPAGMLQRLKDLNIEPHDLAYGNSGIGGYLNKASNRIFAEPGSRVEAALYDAEKWFAKTFSRRKEIIPVIEAELLSELQRYLDTLSRELPLLRTAKEIRKNLNILGLVSFIREELRVYRKDENLLLLPDTTLLLFKIVQENDASFIFEKAGNYYSHFLLDEFQDTSRTQWENFRPLIMNSLATGKENLLVGDVKQSIYRWRDGDWKLLYGGYRTHMHQAQIREERLLFNYRSLPGIIQTNNRIFTLMPEIAAQELQIDLPDALAEKEGWMKEIRGLFHETEQEVPEHKKSAPEGYAAFYCFEEESTEDGEIDEDAMPDWKTKALHQMYDDIELLRGQGFRYSDIAILTRKKTDGTEMLQFLQDPGPGKIPVPVSSSEALQVGACVSVKMIIQALRLLLQESHAPAMASLSLHLQFQGHSDDWISERNENPLAGVPQALTDPEERARLRRLPLFDLMHALMRLLGLNTSAWQHETAFLNAFLDGVLEYMKEESTDIERFLAWWDVKGYRRDVRMPEDQDAIRILTIHKSKGLEFPAVLIPYCEWDVQPSGFNRPWLWCDTRLEGVTDLPLAPVRFGKNLTETLLRSAYYDEYRLNYADQLNLLYVAFTRAEQVLICHMPVTRLKDGSLKKGKVSSWLVQTLERMCLHGNNSLFAMTDGFYFGSPESVSRKAAPALLASPALPVHSYNWMDRLRVKKISRLLPDVQAKNASLHFGVLMHALLEKIRYQKDAEPALDALMFEGAITRDEREVLAQKLQQLMQMPDTQAWFDGSWQVRNEASIMDAQGVLWRPDRVMLKDTDVMIADFKTGVPRPEHAQQLHKYAILLKEMGYPNPQACIVYLSGEAPVLMPVVLSA